MVNERGMDVHHTMVFRWVQEYGPKIDKRSLSLIAPDKFKEWHSCAVTNRVKFIAKIFGVAA